MPFQIYFTRTVTGGLPHNPAFLRPFLTAVRAALIADATKESTLHKPLQFRDQSIWVLVFGQNLIVYRVEDNCVVKVFLRLEIVRNDTVREEDLRSLVQNREAAWIDLLSQHCDEPVSLSLEEIEERYLQVKPTEARWAKAKLDLMVECGSQQQVQQFGKYFEDRTLNLTDKSQYRCCIELLQDNDRSWWCWIRPISQTTIPKSNFQTMLLQSQLYDELRKAPAFRFAFSDVGAYEYLFMGESPGSVTYNQILQNESLGLRYQDGLVLSTTLVQEMILPPPTETFASGYVWQPLKTRTVRHQDRHPILDPNPQSAEEYYNNGSVLGHQGNHQAALAAFEKALLLKPNFEAAIAGWETARRYLGLAEDSGN
jgi:hypothetical protein